MSINREKVVSAVQAAATSDVINLTCDRIGALTGGHGMLNFAIFSVANVIAEELLRGQSMQIKYANERRVPVDDIMERAVKAAKDAGADAANAALIAASVMYLAGSPAQVGIPAGNRKLGATARMIAGADRCGVSSIPTGKMNNKISGFPAVLAINQAMLEGTLSPISGRDIPMNVGGGVYGHSALGEDHIWPKMAENGARIGTQAMLDAMAGAGIGKKPFFAAVLGAAAILEIIHPDADVPESEGEYGRVSTAYLVGKSAAKTAGFPETLHMRLTGEEYSSAHVIGDLGLILKDIGGPSVIGMMAFSEIFFAFKEFGNILHNAPLGHITPYIVPVMRALTAPDADERKMAAQLLYERETENMNPESALVCINTVSRKAAELRHGPVTRFLINVTEPARTKAIYDRATSAFDKLSAGESLADIVAALDEERIAIAERQTHICYKTLTGEDVTLKFLRVEKAARRTSPLAKKYFSFDPSVDIEVTVNGKKAVLEHFTDQLIPKACYGEAEDVAWAIPYATAATTELMMAGNNILNAIIPAAVAAAMGRHAPEEAAAIAEQSAKITCGIPGGKFRATKVAKLAVEIMEHFGYSYGQALTNGTP